jgi:hypothetical protein
MSKVLGQLHSCSISNMTVLEMDPKDVGSWTAEKFGQMMKCSDL